MIVNCTRCGGFAKRIDPLGNNLVEYRCPQCGLAFPVFEK